MGGCCALAALTSMSAKVFDDNKAWISGVVCGVCCGGGGAT